MEPQLFSCGLYVASQTQPQNSRASMEPQLFSCGLNPKLPSEPIILFGFNGAATFQLRIAAGSAAVCACVVGASMEPQLFSCGLFCAFGRGDNQRIASMEPQLFSCGLWQGMDLSQGDFRRFNGAATFQLRIAVNGHLSHTIVTMLQWSRNFSVADCK